MARPKKAAKGEPQVDEETGKTVHATVNGYDSDVVESLVDEIEAEQAKIDAIMDDAKAKCATHSDAIKDLKKAANEEHGIPRKEFNAILSKRRYLQKAENADAKLSDEQKSEFMKLEEALGMLAGTPLGQAAMH
jgi:hypothetical protein